MCKNTSIGNTDKKQPLLQRKVYDIDARKIYRVKTPKAFFSKNNIPRYEKKHHYEDGGKDKFPFSVKLQFRMKAVQKRNGKRPDVQPKVKGVHD